MPSNRNASQVVLSLVSGSLSQLLLILFTPYLVTVWQVEILIEGGLIAREDLSRGRSG
jgi:hypothetical protein